MAYENLNIRYNKMCRGPLNGSLCTINFSNPSNPVLLILNETGGVLENYSILGGLSEELLLCFEYVGPKNLDTLLDDIELFTIEKISDKKSLFKVFRFNTTFKTLNIYRQHIFSDYGEYSFDILGMAVEYYHTSFMEDSDKDIDYIYVNRIGRLNSGLTLFLGPSTDFEYTNGSDVVTAEDIENSENRVVVNKNLTNQYVAGDQITFSNYLYLFSNKGVRGDPSQGSVMKIDLRNFNVVNIDTKPIYKKISGARWCSFFNSIGILFRANILYTNPYNYYLHIKSQFLNNFDEQKKDFYTISDFVFIDNVLYKLSNKITVKNDSKEYVTYEWFDDGEPIYNFQKQNLLSYVNSVSIYSGNSILKGAYKTVTLSMKAIDQFGVGLRDVNLNVEHNGSVAAELNPSSGYVSTDRNGIATIEFTSGETDNEEYISVETDEGSSYTGSVKVFSDTLLFSKINFDDSYGSLRAISNEVTSDSNNLVSLKTIHNLQGELPSISLRGFSFFSVPGGNWVPGGDRSGFDELLSQIVNKGKSSGFQTSGFGAGSGLYMSDVFSTASQTYLEFGEIDESKVGSIANRITTVEDFKIENFIFALKDFYIYRPDEMLPFVAFFTEKDEYDVQLSQLPYSMHSYYVDGDFYDELMTYITLDQFVFIQDAVPAFYSKKNSVYTDIWLRLRPFAYSLNPNTFFMKIKEKSPFKNTGWSDISNEVNTNIFDAGGSLYGIEVLYENPNRFDYNSVIHVYIEVYDTAGNLINVNYWFATIYDYRIPYLTNKNPDVEKEQVNRNSSIYFEIKDEETGVDINSLVLTVNTKIVFPQRIEKISKYHYIVEYTPNEPFLYGKSVDVGVYVGDLAYQQNWLRDGYTFYVEESSGVYLTNYEVGPCKHGVKRYHDISFLALDMGNGVDKEKLRLQVYGKDVTKNMNTKILPIIYRIS